MFNFINEFKESSSETKIFTLTIISIGLILIATTVFSFIRMDYMRSYPLPEHIKTEPKDQ